MHSLSSLHVPYTHNSYSEQYTIIPSPYCIAATGVWEQDRPGRRGSRRTNNLADNELCNCKLLPFQTREKDRDRQYILSRY